MLKLNKTLYAKSYHTFLQTCMTTSLPSIEFIRHPTYAELHLILLPILMSHKGFNEMQIHESQVLIACRHIQETILPIQINL